MCTVMPKEKPDKIRLRNRLTPLQAAEAFKRIDQAGFHRGDRLKPEEVADFLQVKVRTLKNWRWRMRRGLPNPGPAFFEISPGDARYLAGSVCDWLKERVVAPLVAPNPNRGGRPPKARKPAPPRRNRHNEGRADAAD